MLRKRIASAAVLIPLAGAAVYVGGMVLAGLVALLAALAGFEFLRVVRGEAQSAQGPAAPHIVLGLVLLLGPIADAQWPELGWDGWGLAATVLLPLLAQVFRGNQDGSLNGWALTMAGALYIGFSMSHAIRLRALEQGAAWLAVALVGTWANDSGAFFVGRRFGKRRFFPLISPNKTLEGALGGMVLGILAVVGMVFLFGLPIDLLGGVALGVVLTLAATFGDLSESVIKRQLGIKDTARLIPGHGGALDRLDSLLFVLPGVYYVALVLT